MRGISYQRLSGAKLIYFKRGWEWGPNIISTVYIVVAVGGHKTPVKT